MKFIVIYSIYQSINLINLDIVNENKHTHQIICRNKDFIVVTKLFFIKVITQKLYYLLKILCICSCWICFEFTFYWSSPLVLIIHVFLSKMATMYYIFLIYLIFLVFINTWTVKNIYLININCVIELNRRPSNVRLSIVLW